MTRTDIANMRLQAQHVAQADFSEPADVVRHLLAMQAQDYAGALWAVGLRTASSTRADVEQALANRSIIRTWPMRGTLHLLHADDARWMVDLLAPRATAAARGRRLVLGLSDVAINEIETALRRILAGGTVLRRDVLAVQLREQVRSVAIGTEKFGHILRNFGERGIICFGPHDGKQPTFVLLDDWLPPSQPKDRRDALSELAERYFISHGPASLRDFAGWANLPLRDARVGLELASPELESGVVLDTTYYYKPGLEPLRTPSAFLLHGFDECMLGYKDRSASLALEHAPKIVPGNNGMFMPTIVINGQVVGTWKRGIKKADPPVLLQPFTHLTVEERSNLEIAAARYAAFLHEH